ncbi:hypothetical protein ACGFX8_33725 [Streptomyces sp. NPDC048362]|uniref:hypothetical protein n=1 Tax=Streptomyces sp. NPDC048362 TaxID=3365539 RepID=UPI0037154A5A
MAEPSLSPTTLALDLRSLVDAMKVAQARSLTVERQGTAAQFMTDIGLMTRTVDSQRELKTFASDNYLNTLHAELVAFIAETRTLGDEVLAVATVLPEEALATMADRMTAREAGKQVFSTVAGANLKVSDLSKRIATLVTQVNTESAAFDAVLKAYIDSLAGDKGSISAYKASIEAKNKQLATDVANMMAGAKQIGQTVTSFITDSFKMVTGSAATVDKPKPTTTTTTTTTTPSTQPNKAATTDTAGATPAAPSTFNVQDIDFQKMEQQSKTETNVQDSTQAGVKLMDQAAADHTTHMRELADLYMKLAEANVGLGVAVAIKEQMSKFSASIAAVAAATDVVSKSYASMAARAAFLVPPPNPEATTTVTTAPTVTEAGATPDAEAKQEAVVKTTDMEALLKRYPYSSVVTAMSAAKPEWRNVLDVATRGLQALMAAPTVAAKIP